MPLLPRAQSTLLVWRSCCNPPSPTTLTTLARTPSSVVFPRPARPLAAAAASIFRQHRSMSSSSTSTTTPPALQEWLVIVPDHADVLEKRLAARPRHLEGLKEDREDMWLWGGAMLHSPIDPSSTGPPAMKGSACLIGAATREEVLERLKKDVYVTEGVWNLDEVQIIPFKSALRKAL